MTSTTVDINKYNLMIGEVDIVIANIVEEFTNAIALLKNDEKYVRIRLLLAFSFAEVICGIFDKYYNLKLSNKELMKKWFKEYCLIDSNELYKGHPYLRKIDVEYLYQLRCSIVHAYALPEPNGKLAVMFPNGDESTPIIQNMAKAFECKAYEPVFISPDSLTRLFLKGAINFSEEMFVKDNLLTEKQFDAIERVSREFFRRGAKPVPLR